MVCLYRPRLMRVQQERLGTVFCGQSQGKRGAFDTLASLVGCGGGLRLAKMNAKVHEPLKDVGGGIKVAAVFDPFGNLFGIIENPHFDAKKVR